MSTNISKNVKKHVVKYVKQNLFNDLMSKLDSFNSEVEQMSPEYHDWDLFNLADIAHEFVTKNHLSESVFIKRMDNIFNTKRFEILLNRWVIEYLSKLFRILDNYAVHKTYLNKELILEDNSLNRYASQRYFSKFGMSPKISWRKQKGLLHKLISIFLLCLFWFWRSLKSGIKLSGKKKRYKVMHEAVWGLHNGYYFHDDFLVDNDKIKKEDLILFSRGRDIRESGRLGAYNDAEGSQYAWFDLYRLPVGIKPFFTRIIPKYIFGGGISLLSCINSNYYSLFSSVWVYFAWHALQYEKVFSNFKIISELGHHSSVVHIVEAIVCQNYGTRYYLMQWADMSVGDNDQGISFLGCDQYLVWGKTHIESVKGEKSVFKITGYVFKKFIKEVMSNRRRILHDMGITASGKIISFFDETFGGLCKMTGQHYATLWRTALELAMRERDNTVIIKPKELSRHNDLSGSLKQEFIKIKDELEKMPNVYIIDENKWSFIEVIGVSDVVVTQGMTSSATIAIICGIEGLYLSQTYYDHPFLHLFKNKIVFDKPDELSIMLKKIIKGTESPLKIIPESVLRDFDAYDDDCGIDRIRDAVICN